MKKIISAFASCVILLSTAFSFDFSLRVSPVVTFPTQNHYSLGFGGYAQADLLLFNLVTVGLEGGFISETPENFSSSINFTSGGLGLGAYYNPFSRLYLGAGAAIGLYNYSFETASGARSASDLYWRAYGEAGFRFNPTITLSATGGYVSYMIANSSPVLSGPFAGLSVKFNFSAGKSAKGACYADIDSNGAIYPLFQQVYRISPIANATIVNGESAEIRKVKVSFRAGKYTSSALQSEVIPVINRMKKVEVPLYVDFSSELLRFNENGMLSGELVIEYELLGKKKTSIQNLTLEVTNRNSYVWGNNESFAAFISPDTPEVLEYAKYVAGIARNDLYTGMNRNIQFAASMFEALRTSGLVFSDDKQTPYVKYHLSTEDDYIQYPLQTMDFSSGDLDELGILLASCLESVGVETAYMPLDDDFIVFVGMGIKPTAVNNHFGDEESVVVTEDNVYFGLSMAEFSKGFVRSRAKAAELIKKCNNDTENDYEFIATHDAWTIYPPAVYTGSGESLKKPGQAEIKRLTANAVQDYINTDIAKVIQNARASGDSNKIGLAYVKAARYSDAKAEFQKGANTGNVAAINNLANVYFIEKNYSAAISQYKRVLQLDPENKTALRGLENCNSKLGN
ncbi:MAG: tetratricopeptide repeat protein [Treponema sp.]|nr:tetratricopeptide repeat protein [Treponema sp.]